MEPQILSSIESKADLTPPPPVESRKKISVGAVIAAIVIVAGIVVGALYVWGQRVATTDTAEETKTEQPATGLTNGVPQPI
jgi:heme/copper-type cytochrome/quinol oxidase subunit 2